MGIDRRALKEGLRQYEGRYERALQLAEDWMDRTGTNRRGLAKLLGVHHSTLVRFLNREPGYEPSPSRPRMLSILEQIANVCSLEDVVYTLTEELSPEDLLNDDYRAYREDLERLRNLRKHFLSAPEEGLVRLGTLHSNAVHSAAEYRARKAMNVLGTLCCFVDKPQIGALSPAFLRRNVDRALELERAALDGESDSEGDSESNSESADAVDQPPRLRQCALAYTGYVIAHCGLHLESDDLMQAGVDRMLDAVTMPVELEDGIWANTLAYLNLLLQKGHPKAEAWSARCASLASAHYSESLQLTLDTKDLSQLVQHWTQCLSGAGAESVGNDADNSNDANDANNRTAGSGSGRIHRLSKSFLSTIVGIVGLFVFAIQAVAQHPLSVTIEAGRYAQADIREFRTIFPNRITIIADGSGTNIVDDVTRYVSENASVVLEIAAAGGAADDQQPRPDARLDADIREFRVAHNSEVRAFLRRWAEGKKELVVNLYDLKAGKERSYVGATEDGGLRFAALPPAQLEQMEARAIRILAFDQDLLTQTRVVRALIDLDSDGHRDLLQIDGSSSRVAVLFGRPLPPVKFRRGDSNGDGQLNVADATHILQYLMEGTAVVQCQDAADLNDDGHLHVSDAVYLLNHIFSSGAAPAAPYRECGEDETDDRLRCEANDGC